MATPSQPPPEDPNTIIETIRIGEQYTSDLFVNVYNATFGERDVKAIQYINQLNELPEIYRKDQPDLLLKFICSCTLLNRTNYIFDDFNCFLSEFKDKHPTVRFKRPNGTLSGVSISMIRSLLYGFKDIKIEGCLPPQMSCRHIVVKVTGAGNHSVKLLVVENHPDETISMASIGLKFTEEVLSFFIRNAESNMPFPEGLDLLERFKDPTPDFQELVSSDPYAVMNHPGLWPASKSIAYIYKFGELCSNIRNYIKNTKLRDDPLVDFIEQVQRINVGDWSHLVPSGLQQHADGLDFTSSVDFFSYLRHASIHLSKNKLEVQEFYGPHPEVFFDKFRDDNPTFLIRSFVMLERRIGSLSRFLARSSFAEFMMVLRGPYGLEY